MEKHSEYKNAHCQGAFQFIIKSVEKPKDNFPFLYMELHLCRSKPHNISTKRDHLCCVFHVQVQSIQSRINK